jgi:hypothetical protein
MRIVYRERLAEQKSLRILTIVLLQEQELWNTLNAFGRDLDTHRAGHGDDRSGNRPIIAAFVEAGNE